MTSADRLRRLAGILLWLWAGLVSAGEAGVFIYVHGDVTIEESGGKLRTAQRAGQLQERETVRVGVQSWAQLRMRDDAMIALKPDTVFKVEEYRFNGKEDGSERSVVKLIKGGFRTLTGSIGKKNPDQYRIDTVTATIGIRGTDHEPVFIPAEGGWSEAPGEAPGTYDKVNSGATYIETQMGRIELGQSQAGYVPPRVDAMPARLDRLPDFYKAQPTMGGPRPGAAPADARRGEMPRPREAPAGEGGAGSRPMPGPGGPPPPGGVPGAMQPPEGGGLPQRNIVLPGSIVPLNPLPPPGGTMPLPGPAPQPMMPLPGSLPGSTVLPPPPPPPTTSLTDSTTTAPQGFALAGGDKSGTLMGASAGMVGNGDNLSVLLGPNGNPVVVGDNGGSFTYLRNQAGFVQEGSMPHEGTTVRWGIYAGGTIVDSKLGQRNAEFFHFMAAGQSLPQSAVPGFSGRYTTVSSFTSPITEAGWRKDTGQLTTDIQISNGTLTNLSLGVKDWLGRQWTASNVGAIGFAQFISNGTRVGGSVDGSPINSLTSTVSGIPVGSGGTGMIGAYSLQADGNKRVTGSFLAR